MTSSPPKGHNRGPIAPLDFDPNEPPPYDPSVRPDTILSESELVAALKSKGASIEESDLAYLARTEGGPSFFEGPGARRYRYGDAVEWLKTAPEMPTLNRKQATEYIRSLDYQIKDDELQALAKHQRGPAYHLMGREARYTREDLDKWVADRKAGKHPKFFHARQGLDREQGSFQRQHEMEKVTLNLRAGDFKKLQALYGRHASYVIRELVITHLASHPLDGASFLRLHEMLRRRASGWTQEKTAKALGWDRSTIAHHFAIQEAAKTNPEILDQPKLSTARDIARRRANEV